MSESERIQRLLAENNDEGEAFIEAQERAAEAYWDSVIEW